MSYNNENIKTKEQTIEDLKKLREGKGLDEFEVINTAIIYLEEEDGINLPSAVASKSAPANTASHIPG